MLGFPPSTEFNKRIPKQKFYENAAVPAAVKRLFADQTSCAVSTGATSWQCPP